MYAPIEFATEKKLNVQNIPKTKNIAHYFKRHFAQSTKVPGDVAPDVHHVLERKEMS